MHARPTSPKAIGCRSSNERTSNKEERRQGGSHEEKKNERISNKLVILM